MKKSHILPTRPGKLSDMTFDDLYDEISKDWKYKARRLQARRWRMLSRSA
jgi:hypothetical protein